MVHNQKLQAALPVQPEPDEDIEDLKRELPPALDRVVDGLGRIAEIVRSMKEFSHADQREMSQVDSIARSTARWSSRAANTNTSPILRPSSARCRSSPAMAGRSTR